MCSIRRISIQLKVQPKGIISHMVTAGMLNIPRRISHSIAVGSF